MRIGLIADGSAECKALKPLLNKIQLQNVRLLGPLYASMQPKSTAGQIARAAIGKLNKRWPHKIGQRDKWSSATMGERLPEEQRA